MSKKVQSLLKFSEYSNKGNPPITSCCVCSFRKNSLFLSTFMENFTNCGLKPWMICVTMARIINI